VTATETATGRWSGRRARLGLLCLAPVGVLTLTACPSDPPPPTAADCAAEGRSFVPADDNNQAGCGDKTTTTTSSTTTTTTPADAIVAVDQDGNELTQSEVDACTADGSCTDEGGGSLTPATTTTTSGGGTAATTTTTAGDSAAAATTTTTSGSSTSRPLATMTVRRTCYGESAYGPTGYTEVAFATAAAGGTSAVLIVTVSGQVTSPRVTSSAAGSGTIRFYVPVPGT